MYKINLTEYALTKRSIIFLICLTITIPFSLILYFGCVDCGQLILSIMQLILGIVAVSFIFSLSSLFIYRLAQAEKDTLSRHTISEKDKNLLNVITKNTILILILLSFTILVMISFIIVGTYINIYGETVDIYF